MKSSSQVVVLKKSELDDQTIKDKTIEEEEEEDNEEVKEVKDLEMETDADGRRYSYNATTGETTWVDKEEAMEVLTDSSGRQYSYNNNTKVSTWLNEV